MRCTVPVISQEGRTIDHGLGLHPLEPLSPGQAPYRGHGGTVLDASGRPKPHAIDAAPAAFRRLAANG
ncbi:hypothetical protein GCM10019016_125400 [Streptomyces prasinosporus]|uniref:Uncharacterized protein n=1 Tax=Streptomyces prasinosporus TaxID=68256 RepID=A0ABP6UCS5_9ACTN|nr:hypothetical protein GCM10010332_01640 [Streptomyces albogriseolus]